ncbi:MAG: hypothetical protein QXJ68_08455 [Methanocellales archaeon]
MKLKLAENILRFERHLEGAISRDISDYLIYNTHGVLSSSKCSIRNWGIHRC